MRDTKLHIYIFSRILFPFLTRKSLPKFYILLGLQQSLQYNNENRAAQRSPALTLKFIKALILPVQFDLFCLTFLVIVAEFAGSHLALILGLSRRGPESWKILG